MKKITFLILSLTFAIGCTESEDWRIGPSCERMFTEADHCEEIDDSDLWDAMVWWCEDLGERAERAGCGEKFDDLLKCIDKTPACI